MSKRNASGLSQRQATYQTCLHEAGHAVSAYHLGFRVASLQACPDGDAAGTTYVSFWREEPGVLTGTLAVLFVLLSGEAAVYALSGRTGQEAERNLAVQTDLACAVHVGTCLVTHVLEGFGMADAGQKPVMMEEVAHGLCVLIFERAAELLAGPVIRAQVETVAEELMRRKRLSGKQFTRIMEGMTDRAYAVRRLRACVRGFDLEDMIVIAAYGFQAGSAERA